MHTMAATVAESSWIQNAQFLCRFETQIGKWEKEHMLPSPWSDRIFLSFSHMSAAWITVVPECLCQAISLATLLSYVPQPLLWSVAYWFYLRWWLAVDRVTLGCPRAALPCSVFHLLEIPLFSFTAFPKCILFLILCRQAVRCYWAFHIQAKVNK